MPLGCSATIRHAACSWQAIRAISPPNSTDSFGWWSAPSGMRRSFPPCGGRRKPASSSSRLKGEADTRPQLEERSWLLGHDPTRRVIVASYSGDFAAELHRQFRMVVSSEWYAALFPTLRWAKETGLELITTQGGSRYATSVGGTLTGRGADLIIVDDPLNANEVHSEPARKRVINWYGGALVS